MDRHFKTIQDKLADDPALKNVHLVSVSFDPAADTPEVLKAHARKVGADPARWTFVTGDRDEIDKFGMRFGVSVARDMKDPTDITHNLRTAIIDSKGTLVKAYTGNEWTPEAGAGRSQTRCHELTRPAPGFTASERRLIARLRTPLDVQRHLNRLPYNTEPPPAGATLRSFRSVVRAGRANCLEAALFAATVLEQHGYPPLVISFESIDELDHVIFVYRRAGAGDRSPARAIPGCTDAGPSSRRRARSRSAMSIRTSTSPGASPPTPSSICA